VSLIQVYLRALRYLATYRLKVPLIVAANIALAVTAIAEPILFGRIIDSVSQKSGSLLPLAAWVGFAIFSTIATVIVARAADRLAHRARAEVLAEAFERFVSMPVSWHGNRGSSNVFHTLVRACETLFGIWLEFLRSHLATFVALALLVPTAMAANLKLASVLIALGVVYWWIGKVVMNKTKDGQKSVEDHYHTVFSHVSDTISNVSVLHSYNRIEAEAKTLRTYIESLLKAQFPVLDWWALAGALNRMAATISMMTILIIGTFLVRDGSLSVGEIVTFVGFAGMMIGKLDQVRAFVSQIFEARSKLEEFLVLYDETTVAGQVDENACLDQAKGRIEFRNVTFQFPDGAPGVTDVSFVAEPGQTIAVVGPTGAGKTTLINLLQRNLDPQGGEILLDGVDVRTVSRKSVRDKIATVFQDAGLLNRSIASNIRMGRAEASIEDVRNAATAAAANDFIERRVDGYDTPVGEKGSRLSGGERQRIAIARAIIKSAPILVLDEATSALDVETEAAVKIAIDNLSRDRTTFIIAHRLSTVKDADLVLFMDRGRIVEAGSYKFLSQSGGRFTKLLAASGIQSAEPREAVAV
jgi:ATP-binding cassette subfamily B protein